MDILFLLVLAGFLTHEMDAVDKHEWRYLYGFRRLDDAKARLAFIWLHFPLAAIVLWLTICAGSQTQFYSRVALSVFAIIHGVLHYRLRNHPKYEFDLYSHVIIYGTSLFGAMHLIGSCMNAP